MAGSPIDVPLAALIVFAGARLMREVMERLGQPGIVGEILAGILIGPHVLGWLRPNEVTAALSDLGAMFLLFRIGLEVKPATLLQLGRTAFAVAAAGLTASFALGAGVALVWGRSPVAALFIATAIAATSVAIAAETLASRRLLGSRAGGTILAAAVIDDVLGLIALALVSGAAAGGMNWLELASTGILAAGFTLFTAIWGRRAAKHVLPAMESRMRNTEARFTLAIVLLFGLAVLAEYANVAAIVGAFLAGMALSETADRRVHDMSLGVSELMSPFFLAGIGMRFDPAAFRAPSTLGLAAALVVVAILGKVGGCGLGALGLGRRDALRVGVGMTPRGEVSMVVAQLGLKTGAIAATDYAAIVCLAMATTLVAPVLIRAAFRGASGASEPQAVQDHG